MQISKQWSVSDIVIVTLVLVGMLASWFALKSDVKQLSREIALVRSDLKRGLGAAAKDRELIRKEIQSIQIDIKDDIKTEAERAAKDRELIRKEIELIRKEMSRLADQVDRLNQNYIDHLAFHHGNVPKTPNQ